MNLFSKLCSKLSSELSLRQFFMFSHLNQFPAKFSRKYSSSHKLSQILEDASKIVNIPSSHFGIKKLLDSEFDLSSFAINKINMKAMIDSKHPIVGIASDIFDDEGNEKFNKHMGGLVLLLIAAIGERIPSFKPNQEITTKQLAFAEAYELIEKALFIHHQAVLNLPTGPDAIRPEISNLNDGNKISILGGDYLLSHAIVKIANLVKNSVILELLGSAIDDYCIYHFNKFETDSNFLASNAFNTINILDWEEMSGVCSTKLLAYSCQFMLLLARSSERYQKAAFNVGHNLQLIWNLREELDCYLDSSADSSVEKPLKLISAPIIFHMESDPNFFNYMKTFSTPKDLDFFKVKEMVNNGPAIRKCQQLLDSYINRAIKGLDVFPNSSAKGTLSSIIKV